MITQQVTAASGTNYSVIGVLLAIMVPICAATAVIVWNYFRVPVRRLAAVQRGTDRRHHGGAAGVDAGCPPLLVAAAAVTRWCAEVERVRLRPMTGSRV